jgi:hypothetical protein
VRNHKGAEGEEGPRKRSTDYTDYADFFKKITTEITEYNTEGRVESPATLFFLSSSVCSAVEILLKNHEPSRTGIRI